MKKLLLAAFMCVLNSPAAALDFETALDRCTRSAIRGDHDEVLEMAAIVRQSPMADIDFRSGKVTMCLDEAAEIIRDRVDRRTLAACVSRFEVDEIDALLNPVCNAVFRRHGLPDS